MTCGFQSCKLRIVRISTWLTAGGASIILYALCGGQKTQTSRVSDGERLDETVIGI